ncbi:hypothetical protein [Bacillus sp. Marseille-P3661]|uniref:hypothetical protein n=1 Tax=Bacillus sp. Marseille-P3661 TaxID=1936234 RepID=UPI000C82DA3E|nr:hypothetical protein [Bacillus sp. Marseille-P3661]
MNFTLVFKGIERNLSYMLAFEPSPVWKKHDHEWLVVVEPRKPEYHVGGLRQLLNHEKENINEKECIVIIQHEGHGTHGDLRNLELELQHEGIRYQLVSFQN